MTPRKRAVRANKEKKFLTFPRAFNVSVSCLQTRLQHIEMSEYLKEHGDQATFCCDQEKQLFDRIKRILNYVNQVVSTNNMRDVPNFAIANTMRHTFPSRTHMAGDLLISQGAITRTG